MRRWWQAWVDSCDAEEDLRPLALVRQGSLTKQQAQTAYQAAKQGGTSWEHTCRCPTRRSGG